MGCEACGFSLTTDLHHVGGCEWKLVAEVIDRGNGPQTYSRAKRLPRTDDVAKLCPNCHALIHRKGYTLEDVFEMGSFSIYGQVLELIKYVEKRAKRRGLPKKIYALVFDLKTYCNLRRRNQ